MALAQAVPENVHRLTTYVNVYTYGANNFPGNLEDVATRNIFLRNVYIILLAQLAATAGIVAIAMYYEPAGMWIHCVDQKPLILPTFTIAIVVFAILLSSFQEIRKKFPLKLIFLAAFTILMGACLGAAASSFRYEQVLTVAGITMGIAVSLKIVAFISKWDLTPLRTGVMIVALLIVTLLIVTVFVEMRIIQLVFCSISAIFFCFYLVFDTQLMLGGMHMYGIAPEQYVIAALHIYIDIIVMFISIFACIYG